ncbi:transmembrane protein 79-like [Mustelus asterias]
MSGSLSEAQVDSRSLSPEEEVARDMEEEQNDSDHPRSTGSSEDGDTRLLLHSTDTLEYTQDGQALVAVEGGLEMVTLGDAPLACWLEPPGADFSTEEGAAGNVPVVIVDPAVQVVGTAPEDGGHSDPEKAQISDAENLARQPLLLACAGHEGWGAPRGYPPPDAEWPESDVEAGPVKRQPCPRCTRPNLKATAALAGALLVYPCFLYGAYVFLPFDVPLMPDLTTRIIYTLRCGVFATIPIVMGIIVYGLARCCSSSIDPFAPRQREVEIHLRFVTDSIHLLVLFLLNLLVLATYIPQEVLKLLPLLTAFFALARLIYWLTFAISSTFRGFGYGLTFFPIVALLVANLCYMFVLSPDKIFATSDSEAGEQEKASGPRQRFWG